MLLRLLLAFAGTLSSCGATPGDEQINVHRGLLEPISSTSPYQNTTTLVHQPAQPTCLRESGTSLATSASTTAPAKTDVTIPTLSVVSETPTLLKFTELPTGALLIPVITQHDSPTVVPIIFRYSGPPIACFGCLPANSPYLPNIQVKTLNFCIQILWFKIGNCPPDNKDDDGDDGGDDDEDKDKGKSKSNSKSISKPTSSTSSTSSCTVTLKATHKSVFCSITATQKETNETWKGARAKRDAQAEKACITSAHTTITGCSATPVATTVTTTTTTTAFSYAEPTCDPETCGGQSCPIDQGTRSIEPLRFDLEKRSVPTLGDWPDPDDYSAENKQNFVSHQLQMIADFMPNPELTVATSPKSLSSAIFGCTSVDVVSQRGAWMSHIWERDMTQPDRFRKSILQEMLFGLEEGDPAERFFKYGLENLRGIPKLAPEGVMFGDFSENENGNKGNKKSSRDVNTRAFIVTARERPERMRGGEIIPESEFIDDINLNTGTRHARQHADQLADMLREVLDGIPVEIVDYSPSLVPKELYLKFRKLEDERRKAKREKTPEEKSQRNKGVFLYQIKAQYGTPRGKLLLQYRPAKTCNDKAAWRLWIENQEVGSRTDEWAPASNQIFLPGGPGVNAPRQACPMPTFTTARPASETSTLNPSASSQGHQQSPSFSATQGLHQNSTQPIPTGSPHNSITMARGQTGTTTQLRDTSSTTSGPGVSTRSTTNVKPNPTSTSHSSISS
ncbi:hypothetical protein CSAL01_02285 [Colletotrichum salicis]|uniref:Uncharacterized protein n=1 Tax=Colletotrichum salicis TaxID=1209931 RepID=A0A135U1E4_9PEZI|nr:hypothetical protein CSAL01_02285 [Colletotrichum salicis]